MATPKTWTASDIKMSTIRMGVDDTGTLNAVQGYSFVDDTGAVIKVLPGGSVSISVLFADLPANLQTALTEINTYMYQEALTKEGMV